MTMPISMLPAPTVDRRYIADPPGRAETHQPPTAHFISTLFADHKRKIFLIGLAAILAGMALVALDLFSAGIVVPFTAQLTIGLFSFGVSMVAVGVTAKLLTENPSDTKNAGSKIYDSKPVKPRGKRCNKAFQMRAKLPATRSVKATPSVTAAPPVTATLPLRFA